MLNLTFSKRSFFGFFKCETRLSQSLSHKCLITFELTDSHSRTSGSSPLQSAMMARSLSPIQFPITYRVLLLATSLDTLAYLLMISMPIWAVKSVPRNPDPRPCSHPPEHDPGQLRHLGDPRSTTNSRPMLVRRRRGRVRLLMLPAPPPL